MSRTPAADHYSEIAKRLNELKTERMQVIVGCTCPLDMLNVVQHRQDCPLRPQLSITLTGTTAVIPISPTPTTSSNLDKIKNWVAHRRTILPLILVSILTYDPHILFLSWSAARQEILASTNRMTCTQAMSAISEGRWMKSDPPAAMRCIPGNAFAPKTECIAGYNCRKNR